MKLSMKEKRERLGTGTWKVPYNWEKIANQYIREQKIKRILNGI